MQAIEILQPAQSIAGELSENTLITALMSAYQSMVAPPAGIVLAHHRLSSSRLRRQTSSRLIRKSILTTERKTRLTKCVRTI